jgi:single-stranded-DNA-specific exonuclease
VTRAAPRRDAPPTAEPPRPEVRWHARPPAPPDRIAPLVRQLGVPPLLASILWARGLAGEAARAALDPPLTPSAIPTLDDAAGRLAQALDRGERILVHGDYDADGITGTAVLTLGLRALGGRVEPFLPNRLTHGYGLHPDLVDAHAARSELLVTVDCGIANVDEVAHLRNAGVDVIVTDHHTPGTRLPDALVVHPSLAADAPPLGAEPTGAGVAFHLLWRLHRRLGLDDPLDYADLATIGTVADVAPLLGDNRALVREGLARMPGSSWPGVRAMLAQSRLRGAPSARDVAFVLAPRLNAAGRLGQPEKGLELLLAGSERRARELAVYLDAHNDERKRIQDEMTEAALAQVDPDAPAIVVHDDAWHPGVMGIVASKLLERFYRPVFILARGQGSVRSTPGISAVEALRAAGDELLRFGGHTAAAGFAIDPERIPAFRERVCAFVAQHPVPAPEVTADAVLDPGQVDEDLWRAIQQLEPFGEGHPAPRFAIAGDLHAARAVGRDARHLQLRVRDVKGVAWDQGERAAALRPGQALHVAAALRENVWNERRTIEFVADALRPAAPLPLAPAPDGEAVPSARAHVRRGTPSSPDAGRRLLELPLGDDPLRAHEPLAGLLAEGRPLWFDLDADAQGAVARAARRYPTVHEVRRAFVALRAGARPPLGPDAARLALRALRELDLVDERDRARAGVARVDPYASATLTAGLLQRYRLETFLNAFRHLDDDGFARAVVALFVPG